MSVRTTRTAWPLVHGWCDFVRQCSMVRHRQVRSNRVSRVLHRRTTQCEATQTIVRLKMVNQSSTSETEGESPLSNVQEVCDVSLRRIPGYTKGEQPCFPPNPRKETSACPADVVVPT